MIYRNFKPFDFVPIHGINYKCGLQTAFYPSSSLPALPAPLLPQMIFQKPIKSMTFLFVQSMTIFCRAMMLLDPGNYNNQQSNHFNKLVQLIKHRFIFTNEYQLIINKKNHE